MSIERFTHGTDDNPLHDTLIDAEGNVVVPESNDKLGNVYDFTRKTKRSRHLGRVADTAQFILDFDAVPEVAVEGPSVRLNERHDALAEMKQRYANYKGALGLQKAAHSEKHRPKVRRTVANLDLRAPEKVQETKYSAAQERAALMPLLKTDELIAAGFPRNEVEVIEQDTIHSIRNSFGLPVDARTRNKNMKRVNPGTSE